MRVRKPTVAELRERELPKLAAFKTDNPTAEDIAEARRIMNRFYRLCGLSERNFYLSNDERYHALSSTRESEEKEARIWKKLDADVHRLYGLNIVYCGICPSIVERCEHGGVSEKIGRFFYE